MKSIAYAIPLIILLAATVGIQPSLAAPISIKVLDFNAWLLRVPLVGDLAQDIDERLTLMPDAAQRTGADLIFLTEVWEDSIRARLIADMENRGYRYHALKSGDEILQESTCPTPISGANTGTAIGHQIAARLPRAPAFVVSAGLIPLVFGPIDLLSDGLAWIADYGRSRLGNGLLLFSKYPLDAQVDCLRYSEFTRWDEALAAKGALKARVDLPVVGWTDAYLTHLGATTYREKEKRFDADEVQAQREQLDELVAWIQKTRDSRNLILSGDFNQHWQAIENGAYQPALSPGYATLVGKGAGQLDLIDSFRQVHPQSVADYTSDVTGNPYSDNPLDKSLSTQPSVVDDYIFVSRDSALRPQAADLVFNTPVAPEAAAAYQLKRVPKRLSDHYGVLTTFALPPG